MASGKYNHLKRRSYWTTERCVTLKRCEVWFKYFLPMYAFFRHTTIRQFFEGHFQNWNKGSFPCNNNVSCLLYSRFRDSISNYVGKNDNGVLKTKKNLFAEYRTEITSGQSSFAELASRVSEFPFSWKYWLYFTISLSNLQTMQATWRSTYIRLGHTLKIFDGFRCLTAAQPSVGEILGCLAVVQCRNHLRMLHLPWRLGNWARLWIPIQEFTLFCVQLK